MNVVLGLIAAIVALYALMFWLNNGARRQEQFQIELAADQAAEIVAGSFSGITWTETHGPGHLNRELRSINGDGPTLSINVADAGDGMSDITLWMSNWTMKSGSILGSDRIMAKKRKIMNRLQQASVLPEVIGVAAVASGDTVPAAQDAFNDWD